MHFKLAEVRMPELTKLIPFLQQYPAWVQSLIGLWIVFSALLLILLIFTPRTISTRQSAQEMKANDERNRSSGDSIITQETRGDNSPAVSGVEGDVTITTEQRKNAK